MKVRYAALGLAAGVLIARAARPSAGSFHGRVALISGGTRGLGLQLARELGGRGAVNGRPSRATQGRPYGASVAA